MGRTGGSSGSVVGGYRRGTSAGVGRYGIGADGEVAIFDTPISAREAAAIKQEPGVRSGFWVSNPRALELNNNFISGYEAPTAIFRGDSTQSVLSAIRRVKRGR